MSEPTTEAGAPHLASEMWASTPVRATRKLPLAAILFLLLTAAISLTWSHYKLLSQDEIFSLHTDFLGSVSRIVDVQRSTPISLDPLVYHLLSHFSGYPFGGHAFALRLPSFLGYLLMQLCLFFIVRRISGERAGVLALAFPALTATLFYSAEGRPYGLLLGLYALTLLAWQTAIHRAADTPLELSSFAEGGGPASAPPQTLRTATTPGAPFFRRSLPKGWGALCLLTLAIALTLNTHYFGILLLIPLCAAELLRTLHRRRIDIPVLTAIILGMAAIVFTLPFQKAAAEFRQHYYNGGTVGIRAITQSYRSLFVDYTHTSPLTQRIAAIAFVLCALALIAAVARHRRQFPFPESVFILTLAALPLFGFLLARFVTHSIEVRYVLGAIIGITILLTVVLAPTLRRDRNYTLALALLTAGILTTGLLRIRAEIHTRNEIIASLIPSPELKAAIAASPTQFLYIQDMGHFEVATYYERDPFVASHLALLYGRDEELRYDQHDTVSLTALHMREFTGFTIVPYEDLRREPGPHTLILFHSGWDWTDQALARDQAIITPLGPALGGDAVSIRFPK